MNDLYDTYTHQVIRCLFFHQQRIAKKKEPPTEEDANILFGNIQSLLRDFVNQIEEQGKNKVSRFIAETRASLHKLQEEQMPRK